MKQKTIQNQTIWITGASSGIGKELCFQLLNEGVKVIASSRNGEELQKLYGKWENCFVLPLNYEKSETFSEKVQQAIAHFGQVDVLINNGGVSQRATAMETEESVMRRLMEINYFGHVLLSKALLPHFLERKSGMFVEISSIAGLFGYFRRTSYSATKHAVKGFFESLALEHYPHVHVLMVYPGKIKTSISKRALAGDGSVFGKEEDYQDLGYSAEGTAKEIIEGIRKRKREVYPGGKEMKAVWMKRFFPGKLFKILLKKSDF